VVHQLKSGIWKPKQSLMKLNQKNNVHHWHGQLMVKHYLLVLPIIKYEYLKFNNVKLTKKAITTEEYITSVIIIIEKETQQQQQRKQILFCKPTIFNLLVVIIIVMKTKTKKKEND
jgi:hypothetical protein